MGRHALRFDAPELIERVFDAGFHPELWDPILGELARGHRACVGGLAIHDGARFVVEPHLHGMQVDELALREILGEGNPFQPVAARLAFGAVVRTELLVPPAELHRTIFYERLLRPLGAEYGLGLCLTPPGGLGGFVLFRDLGAGPFTEEEVAALRRFQPHLLGAVRVMHRLGTTQLGFRLGGEVLERLAVPVFLCAEDGEVRFLNAAASALIANGSPLLVRGRLEAASSEENAILGALIHDAASAPRTGYATSGGTMTLACGEGQPALELMVAPLARMRAELPPGDLALVVASSALARSAASELLRARYSLTPAELRLALLTCEGRGLVDVAQRLSVSINTARTHLQRVFDKTGTTRQAELVRLFTCHPATLVREQTVARSGAAGARARRVGAPRAKRSAGPRQRGVRGLH